MDKAESFPRHLDWANCLNTRDLGGYPAAGGETTRWRALVRSDSLHKLTPAGMQALLDYGVRTIVDLRDLEELQQEPNPFTHPAFPPGKSGESIRPDYVNVRMSAGVDLVWPSHHSPSGAMAEMYLAVLEKNREFIAGALGAIAHARPGGVLVHCAAGKDRTGAVIAMALAAAGVASQAIAEDYSLSFDRIASLKVERFADPELSHAERLRLEVLFTSLPETMLNVLDSLEARYGGATGYLATTPLPPEDVGLLRRRLLDAPAP